MTLALSILAIGVLILVHEFGHFLFARAFGMKVEVFSIGFGPALLSVKGKRTEYRLAVVPLGGYVRIGGMAPGDGTPEDDPQSFANRPAWQRLLVLLAGPFVNWLFGFLLLAGLFMAGWQEVSTEPVIGRIADHSPAAAVGLQPGDRVVQVGPTSVATWQEMTQAIQAQRPAPMDLKVRRGEAELTFRAKVGPDGRLGLIASTKEVRYPFGPALGHAFVQTGVVIGKSFASLAEWVGGSPDVQVSGPVGIVRETAEAARSGLFSLFAILVMISLGLAVMNLLPLPALDGGRIAFVLVEMIRRRPVSARIEAVVHAAGMIVLLAFMLWVTVGEVGRRTSRDAGAEAPAADAAAAAAAAPDAGAPDASDRAPAAEGASDASF